MSKLEIIILVACAFLLLPIPMYGIARWVKPLRKFYCWLGWHDNEGYEFIEFDGASDHCKCKWCGYKGMVDGQGNLF